MRAGAAADAASRTRTVVVKRGQQASLGQCRALAPRSRGALKTYRKFSQTETLLACCPGTCFTDAVAGRYITRRLRALRGGRPRLALFEMSVVEQRYQAVPMVLAGVKVVDVAARFGRNRPGRQTTIYQSQILDHL